MKKVSNCFGNSNYFYIFVVSKNNKTMEIIKITIGVLFIQVDKETIFGGIFCLVIIILSYITLNVF